MRRQALLAKRRSGSGCSLASCRRRHPDKPQAGWGNRYRQYRLLHCCSYLPSFYLPLRILAEGYCQDGIPGEGPTFWQLRRGPHLFTYLQAFQTSTASWPSSQDSCSRGGSAASSSSGNADPWRHNRASTDWRNNGVAQVPFGVPQEEVPARRLTMHA